MWYEEKFVNGKMCYRTKSSGAWTPLSVKELSRMYVQLQMSYTNLQLDFKEAERIFALRKEQPKVDDA